MPLSDTACKNAKTNPDGSAKKHTDGRGMYLYVSSTGKNFRFDYRYDGKRLTLSLGVYPDVSLAKARERLNDARKLLADGIDPGAAKKAEKLAPRHSFEAIAREWYAKQLPSWSKSHAIRIIRRLEADIFPWIGNESIEKISAQVLLQTLRRIESRGAIETAHRVKDFCGQIFRFAIVTGRAERDVSADLRGALSPVKPAKNFAAVVNPGPVAELLRAIDGYKGTLIVNCALRLAPLVFVRPGELRQAEWSEIDLDAAEWNIPPERMKLWLRRGIKTPFLVPLSRQAIAILKEIQPLTGKGRYVFPSLRSTDRPMSDNAILSALRRMGIPKVEMSGHGFRAMARTMLRERLRLDTEVIEHQLAHAVKDANGTAYNRTKFLEDRIEMMQTWADYLDTLKAGGEVITLPRRAA